MLNPWVPKFQARKISSQRRQQGNSATRKYLVGSFSYMGHNVNKCILWVIWEPRWSDYAHFASPLMAQNLVHNFAIRPGLRSNYFILRSNYFIPRSNSFISWSNYFILQLNSFIPRSNSFIPHSNSFLYIHLCRVQIHLYRVQINLYRGRIHFDPGLIHIAIPYHQPMICLLIMFSQRPCIIQSVHKKMAR